MCVCAHVCVCVWVFLFLCMQGRLVLRVRVQSLVGMV